MELWRAFIEGSLILNKDDVERGADSMFGEELTVDDVLAEIVLQLYGDEEVPDDFNISICGDRYLYEEDIYNWLRMQTRCGFTSQYVVDELIRISHRLNWNDVSDRRDKLPRLEHGWDLTRSIFEHL